MTCTARRNTASTRWWSSGATADSISTTRPSSGLLRRSRPWPRCARCSVSDPLHVTFVCTGNICRSPMAEKMFAHQIRERGLDSRVRVTSAGTGDWHVGCEVGERAERVLRAHGYPTAHRAAQLNTDHLG